MMNKADKMALIEVNERLAMNKLIKVESVVVHVTCGGMEWENR